MEIKHTEPPFHIAFHPQSDEYSIHSMPSHPQDAGPNVLSAKHVGVEHAKANAKLFSAAPDLLDSCLELFEYYKTECSIPNLVVLRKAQEAIKKATE